LLPLAEEVGCVLLHFFRTNFRLLQLLVMGLIVWSWGVHLRVRKLAERLVLLPAEASFAIACVLRAMHLPAFRFGVVEAAVGSLSESSDALGVFGAVAKVGLVGHVRGRSSENVSHFLK